MKLNRIITLCAAVAALVLTAGTASAQNGGGGGGGGGGRGNFDPAAMMQRTMDRLGFTNETDAAAVQPLVQKVMDARRAMGGGFGGRGGRGGQGGGGGGGGQGGPNAQTNPERQALQDALDNDAPAAQVKELLTKYQASQKAKQATLTAAQEDLRKVLNSKQEAQATLMGLLN